MRESVMNLAIKTARDRRRLPSPAARRFLREGAGLTQAELAAAIGVSRAALSRWEAGNRFPRRGNNLGRYLAILDTLAKEGLK